eukprot:TRINITY_DN18959_c0_g1_i1.p1 TRINITY_DN18959_c0_g1~~TRINITY_DN18959_c0_g1_i1.p1  ORF type:complete len:689 (-),score=161.68 TRINITY_DN18959_c0_g1_i1:34-2100(-)
METDNDPRRHSYSPPIPQYGESYHHLSSSAHSNIDSTRTHQHLSRRRHTARLLRNPNARDEIARRTSRGLGKATKPQHQGALFEHFLVVGLPSSKEKEIPLPNLSLADSTSSNTSHFVAPVTEPLDAQVLYQYPPDVKLSCLESPSQLGMFCFPNGITPGWVKKTASLSSLHEIIFASLDRLEESSHSFIFMITGLDQLYYGICVKRPELLSEPPSFLKVDPKPEHDSSSSSTPTDAHIPPRIKQTFKSDSAEEIISRELGGRSRSTSPTASATTTDDESEEQEPGNERPPKVVEKKKRQKPKKYVVTSPRCYCFISRFPFFQLHFEVLYCLLALERHNKFHSWMNPSSLSSHFNSSSKNTLFVSSEGSPSVSQDGTKPRSIVELLNAYYTIRLKTGHNLSFNLPGKEMRHFDFLYPEGEEPKLIADFCLPSLIKLFTLAQIVQILTALVLEQKILVHCPNLGILSSIILSFIPLLSPYTWQGTYIPILPESLKECIESPVPFIMGVTTLAPFERTTAEENHVWIVDVIKDQPMRGDFVHYSTLPELPYLSQLVERLRGPYRELHKKCESSAEMLKERGRVWANGGRGGGGEEVAVREWMKGMEWWWKERIIGDVEVAAKIPLERVEISSPKEEVRKGVVGGVEEMEEFVKRFPMRWQPFFSVFLGTQTFSVGIDRVFQKRDEGSEAS